MANLSRECSRIEAALLAGCRLHAFQSGGGLRVVRLEFELGGGVLRGYGEHPCIEEALRIAADDYEAGGRPYEDVFNGVVEAAYLTGSRESTSPFDAWLRGGSTFDAWREGGEFVVELRGYSEHRTPEALVKRVLATGVPEEHEQRGFRYRTVREALPSGYPSVLTSVVSSPPHGRGANPWMWDERRVGRAGALGEALEAALAAQPVEA